MKSLRRDADDDYVDQPITFAAARKSYNKKARLPSFLTQHADEIWQLQRKAKLGPTAIAERLCTNNGLAAGAITSRQVSNWIGYQKRSRGSKTASVSLKNQNLKVNPDDSCELFL